MATSSVCAVCKESFGLKYGVNCCRDSKVPLYKETTRKEIVGNGRSVKIASLLEEIGITVTLYGKPCLSEHSLCKKCARKISNCHRAYREIASAIENSKIGEGESSYAVSHFTEKRSRDVQSPTGLTPSKKRVKTTVQSTSTVSSRKRLFKPSNDVEDEISRLMSLPVEKRDVATVKVSSSFFLYF